MIPLKGGARILLWDIESTGLVADFGTILCVGYKWLGEKTVHVPSIMDYPGWRDDPTDDKRLIKDFRDILMQADMIITYNGKRFDVPFVTAKLLEHNLPLLPNIPHVDLYFTVKSNLRISRKSLQNVSYYIRSGAEKTAVEGRIWKKAQGGDKASIHYIKRHCVADVEVLERCYMKLRPLCRMHPRVNGYGTCRYCGSDKLQGRGRQVSILKGAVQRVCCADCSGWDSRPYVGVNSLESSRLRKRRLLAGGNPAGSKATESGASSSTTSKKSAK